MPEGGGAFERREREREKGDFWRAFERRLPLESF